MPAAKAAAPGRIAAAGTMRGARWSITPPAIRHAQVATRQLGLAILVAPFLASRLWESWLSSIAPQASTTSRSSKPATWLVSK